MPKFGEIYIEKRKFHVQTKAIDVSYVNNMENKLASNKYCLEWKHFKCVND